MRSSALVIALAAIAVAWACGDDPVTPTCTGIPAGGCPSEIGGACADPSCAAVYSCTVGGWSLVRECPPRDSGTDTATAVDGASDAPALRDVDIDVPGANGGPGCPDLQPPDCPLGLAAACPAGCCGCEDLFVCGNAGWNSWGTCGDGGTLVPAH